MCVCVCVCVCLFLVLSSVFPLLSFSLSVSTCDTCVLVLHFLTCFRLILAMAT